MFILYVYIQIHKKMEKRLNKKASTFINSFKEDIQNKFDSLGLLNTNNNNEDINSLLLYIKNYEELNFDQSDTQKRKRIKNIVPQFDRCCAKRANNEQCTRRRKNDHEYCGTHIKGIPHGFISKNDSEQSNNIEKVEIWTQDIGGIIYYIDKNNNVYNTEDIMNNHINPSVIAKCEYNGETFTIPQFNI